MTEQHKQDIIALIAAGQKLPKHLIYELFADDEEDVFLFWNGRREDTTNIALPFHSIEHIDEPRKEAMKAGDMFQMFDTRGRQLQGWTNKLIWGDNKLILSSLANGPLRRDIEAEGGLKLIYIDPPFAVGADFGFNVEIGGETAEKRQSVIEEIAYRDTWGRGISSYLSMMYERLKLMHQLLSEDGSIYVHVGWQVASLTQMILNDVFGSHNYHNTISWKRSHAHGDTGQGATHYGRITDYIFFYSKNEKFQWNAQYNDYTDEILKRDYKYTDSKGVYRLTPVDGPGGASKGNPHYEFLGVNGYWRFSKERMQELYDLGEIVLSSTGKSLSRKKYLEDAKGTPVADLWDDVNRISPTSAEGIGYPTQKPEALLERIIKASSNEGDLIADFFCGSGTTAAVAEKLGRKWVTTDLGRFSVHTARKRLIGVQREQQAAGHDFRAFEVLNLGKYERQFFMSESLQNSEQQYIALILEAYRAKPFGSPPSWGGAGGGVLHGSKTGRMVHIGPMDVPVTQSRLESLFDACRAQGITSVDVLGFEFEMGLSPFFVQELRERGLTVHLKHIPREVFDKRAVEKGQAKFFDVAYVDARIHAKGLSVQIELTDFVTHYTQDDLEEVQHNLKKGSKVVIDEGQILKLEKDERGVLTRTLLTNNWYDWIDYWAIDFDYHSKKEIIKVPRTSSDDFKSPDGYKGEYDEVWSGNYLFENEWQSFRTKKDPTLEFMSAPHEYKKPGTYKMMVKVVDILGIDSSKMMEVQIG
jgi:adenine-specific DNA-methyltransferase